MSVPASGSFITFPAGPVPLTHAAVAGTGRTGGQSKMGVSPIGLGARQAQTFVAVFLVSSSFLAAPSPDPEMVLAASREGGMPPPYLACHLGLCLRRELNRCSWDDAARSELAGTAGVRFEHSFSPGEGAVAQVVGAAQDNFLPAAAFVAELIPFDDAPMTISSHLHHRYSTHLYMHDDLVTLKTSLVVLDPGRFQLVHGLAVAGGLTGSYYDNTGQRGEPPLSRTDAQVDFDWDLGAIGGLSVADFAGVRWCGYLGVNDVPSTRATPDGHKYVIWLDLGAESDGARLWINGTLIIDAWDRGHERLPSASILLRPGTLNSLTLEYRHTRGQAAIRLLWSSPWTILQPIPSKNLFHTVSLERPVDLRVNHGRPFTASMRIGQGQSILTAGKAVNFKILARDAFANVADSTPAGTIVLDTVSRTVQDIPHGSDVNASAWTQHGVEAVRDIANAGYEGLLQITTAGSAIVEAFYGAQGALSATYYTTDDVISYRPEATGLWHGSITSINASQLVSTSLVLSSDATRRTTIPQELMRS